jgi:hypothetical protein
LSLKDKVDKKRDELLKQNEEVWSRIGKGGINWRKAILNIISVILIILIIIFWDPLTTFLANELRENIRLLGNQTQASVVANYLLAILILATVGVEFIPILRDWRSSPNLRLHSFSYVVNTIRVINHETGTEEPRKVYTVYLNLYNEGRGEAIEPQVLAEAFPNKLPRFLPSDFGASTINRELTHLSANVYEHPKHDELASDFIEKGMKKVDYIPGHHSGRRFVLGFAFEGGSHFYWASAEGPEQLKVKLQTEPGYASFLGLSRGKKKKTLKMNTRMDLAEWDKVKFPDFVEWEIPQPKEVEG